MSQPNSSGDCSASQKFCREALAILVMLACVCAVYIPPNRSVPGTTLQGADSMKLHERRIRFAREALFGPQHALPGWYSAELMGAPFWSNIQSFPFIPTRFILFAVDPSNAYALGIEIAACLTALFTYLYCREIGLGRIASAAGGFTFACSGYFAVRVFLGFLPHLEAFPSLPLLFWLIEKCARSARAGGWWMLSLGLAASMTALGGVPQLPAYSLVTAFLYAIYRMPNRRGARAVAAIVLGFGCSAFQLWPLARLVLLSTRFLHLDPPTNDIILPYWRIKEFLFPWADGFPIQLNHSPKQPFIGGPEVIFWDTFCYVGVLPIVAGAFCVIRCVVRRKLPPKPWLFLAIAGLLALVLALPFGARLASTLPFTIFRSPSRQLYITCFSFAVGFGGAINLLLAQRAFAKPLSIIIAFVLLSIHAIDLVSHDLPFIVAVRKNSTPQKWSASQAREFGILRRDIGDARVCIGVNANIPPNRQIDDVTFFDSILLAKQYVALLETSGISTRSNLEEIEPAELTDRALAFAGVKYEIRPGYPAGGDESLHIFPVPHPSKRAEFFPVDCVRFLDSSSIHQNLRNPEFDLQNILMLPADEQGDLARSTAILSTNNAGCKPLSVSSTRPTTDEIDASVKADGPGYLRVLEAWHPGWHATIDGRAANVVIADETFLAVPLLPGIHAVRFTFSTPGKVTGLCISSVSFLLLAGLSSYKSRPDQ